MIPERIITAADLVEAVLELQKIIETEGETARTKALHEKIATAVFEAEAETLQGVMTILDKMIEDQIIGPNPFKVS